MNKKHLKSLSGKVISVWTYKHPYREPLTAAERIQYHARAELFRAMNIGRQVAFIGSGVTAAYGRPSWDELLLSVVNAVDQLYRSKMFSDGDGRKEWATANSAADRLHTALRQQFGEQSLHLEAPVQTKDGNIYEFRPINACFFSKIGDKTSTLALCTDLAEALGETDYVKMFVAKLFLATPLQLFLVRLSLLNGTGEGSPFYKLLCPVFENQDDNLIQNKVGFFLDKLETDIRDAIGVSEQCEDLQEKIDTIFQAGNLSKSVLKNRGSLEAEIFLWERLNEKQLDESEHYDRNFAKSILCAFLFYDIDHSKGPDPIGVLEKSWKIKRFVTLNYDLEIENYFLKKRQYVPKSGQKPLKELLANNAEHTPFIAENQYGGKLISSSINSDNIGDLTDFSSLTVRDNIQIVHLHGRADCFKDLVITEYDYQHLYLKNHYTRRAFDESVQTLFAGNDVVFVGIGMTESDYLRPMREFMSQGQDSARHRDGIVALMKEDKKQESETRASDAESQAIELKTKYDINSSRYKIDAKFPKASDFNPLDHKECLTYMIEARKYNLEASKSFEQHLKKLSEDHKNWWQEWNALPNNRYALYRQTPSIDAQIPQNQDTAIIWSRRTLKAPENLKDNPPINPEIENVKEAIKEYQSSKREQGRLFAFDNRRIALLLGKEGVGKGSFISSLQSGKEISGIFTHNYKHLFENDDECVVHAFFGDSRYSTDFNSVISAFTRFVCGRLAGLVIEKKGGISGEIYAQKIKELQADAFASKTIKCLLGADKSASDMGRLELLTAYLKEFRTLVEKRDKKQRIFLCLSYLDQLTDENGREYNFLHRSFIETLTSRENADLPLDILFVTSNKKEILQSISSLPGRLSASDYENGEQAKLKGVIPVIHLKKQPLSTRKWIEIKLDATRYRDILKYGFMDENADPPPESHLYNVVEERVSIHLWIRALVERVLNCENSLQVSKGLNTYEKKERDLFLKSAFERLEFAASQKRQLSVVSEILDIYEMLDREQRASPTDTRIFRTILRRLAFFSTPIERGVIASCPDIIELYNSLQIGASASEREIAEWLEHYISELFKRGLLICLSGGRRWTRSAEKDEEEDKKYNRYVLHSLLRKHLESKMDYSIFERGEHSFFDVSLYMTQPRHLPKPKDEDFHYLGSTLMSLVEQTRNDLSLLFQLQSKEEKLGENAEETKTLRTRIRSHFESLDTYQSPTQRLRAAKNLIAHAFSVGVISRLGSEENGFSLIGENKSNCPFENYQSWTRGITNAATGITETRAKLIKVLNDHGDEEPDDKKTSNPHIRFPFYSTEIAWLYNERALVNFVQGKLYDSLPLYEKALEVIQKQKFCKYDDYHMGPSSSYRRVMLNKALARLEFGKISEAKSDFILLKKTNSATRNSDSVGLTKIIATGYLGLCDHLIDRLDTAEECYDQAIKMLEQMPHRLRTKAIFLKFRADLNRTKGNYDRSLEDIESSIRSAKSVAQQDILHHAMVSKALIVAEKDGNYPKAYDLLRRSEIYAEKLGIPKLTVDASIIRSKILLSQGQFDKVGEYLTTSIAICNKNGMTLRKIAALNQYGDFLKMREDDQHLSDRVLAFADHLAEKTGYMSRTNYSWQRKG
ncbi:MAG: SIR2 family protein [Sneathiellales bacterium]|nr:SIR2 family protein [Sneathiellales bacterium]